MPTREEIIKAPIELDAQSEKTVGRSALIRKVNGLNQYQITELIPEGLTKLKESLGLKVSPQERPHEQDALLEAIDKTVSRLGCVPTWVQLRRETGITSKVFIGNFGKQGKFEVYTHYAKWLRNRKPRSKNIKLIDGYLESQIERKTPSSRPPKRKGTTTEKRWPKGSGTVYGAPLHFGNLMCEPVNEQGVVFLFGMVSKALGFSIECIRPEFPDCLGKRYIEGKGRRQQRVRIEFEHESRNYDHRIDGCDIIVCWEHNWPDCPLEVIELRTEIERLRELPEFSPA
jgi:hypothetical protein